MANPTLEEFRKQYPDYNDLSDAELSAALVKKDPAKWSRILPPPPDPMGSLPGIPPTSMGQEALGAGKTALDLGLSIGGPVVGGLVGGPAGAMLGGVAGMGAANLLRPPQQQMGPEEIGLWSVLGGLPGAGVKGVTNLGSRTLKPEDLAIKKAAASFADPISLTAGEQTGSAGLAQVEAYGAKFPASAQRIKDFQAARRTQVQSATGEIAGDIGARRATSATAGAQVKGEIGALAAAQPSAAEEALNRFSASIGRGAADREVFGKTMRDALWQANRDRRAAASAVYDGVASQLGDKTGPAINLNAAATGLVEQETGLLGVQDTKTLRASTGLGQQTGPIPTVVLTPEQQIEAMRMANRGTLGGPGTTAQGAQFGQAANIFESRIQKVADLPTDFVKQYGLDQPRPRSFGDLREIQSRLGSMIRSTQDDSTRRRLKELFDGVSQDINTIAGETGASDLAAANNFYKNEVATLFGRKTYLRGIMGKTENDKVADALLATDSPAQVKSILRVVSPQAGSDFRATVLNKLHDGAIDPVSGQFSPEKYLRGLSNYSEDTMRAMLGTKFSEFARLRDMLQRDVQPGAQDAVFKRVLGAEDRLALQTFTKENASKDVTRVMDTLSPDVQQQARGARWNQIVQDSTNDKTGSFEFGRFLTQINKMDPATRTAFFGDQVTEKIGNLERVLQRVVSEGGVRDSTQGIGSQIGAMAQIGGSLRYAGGILTGSTTIPQALANGLVLVSPSMIAKLATDPRGIELLVHGLQIKPGTIKAVEAAGVVAAQMARLLDQQTGQEAQATRLQKVPPGAARSKVYRGAAEEQVQ